MAASGIDDGNIIFSIPSTQKPEDHIVYGVRADSGNAILVETSSEGRSSDLLRKWQLSLPSYLMLPASNLHVLLSIKSGAGSAEQDFEHIVKPLLAAAGITDQHYTITRTTSSGSITEFARSTLCHNANSGVAQTVILFSGDGGIVDLINGILSSSSGTNERPSSFMFPNVAQFASGTGNALFHSINRDTAIPASSEMVHALRNLFYGTPCPLPTFQAKFTEGSMLLSDEGRKRSSMPDNTLFGAVVASYGFHATLVADSDTAEYRKFGDKRFGMVASQLLENPHVYKAKVSFCQNGKSVAVREQLHQHAYLLATLVSNLEKTFTISPASKPLDGRLRLVDFGPLSGSEIMQIMMSAYDGGKHVSGEQLAVGYNVIDSLTINFLEDEARSTWRRVCIDGLIVEVPSGGSLTVSQVQDAEGAINIVGPVSRHS